MHVLWRPENTISWKYNFKKKIYIFLYDFPNKCFFFKCFPWNIVVFYSSFYHFYSQYFTTENMTFLTTLFWIFYLNLYVFEVLWLKYWWSACCPISFGNFLPHVSSCFHRIWMRQTGWVPEIRKISVISINKYSFLRNNLAIFSSIPFLCVGRTVQGNDKQAQKRLNICELFVSKTNQCNWENGHLALVAVVDLELQPKHYVVFHNPFLSWESPLIQLNQVRELNSISLVKYIFQHLDSFKLISLVQPILLLTTDKNWSVKLTIRMNLEWADVLILKRDSLSILSSHISKPHLDSAIEWSSSLAIRSTRLGKSTAKQIFNGIN